ncbi:hypothetical protein [Pararhodobacter sp.]|uniref:hypothetical protein n=1 Tax=Pararhodobacter sp. TaxID=2127056 RepID=UPI002AFE33CB|nr:hypothetical protein [Pararhodobacter sp.]
MARTQVFDISCGPSNGPELIALLYADEKHLGYWYGHIRRHPLEGEENYVACLAFCKVFINAPTVPLFFQRFDYWTRIRLEYEPCTVQLPDDAYVLTGGYEEAIIALEIMIQRFDIEKRFPDEGARHHTDPIDMRVMDLFGMHNYRDGNGVIEGPPMPKPVAFVRGIK